MSRKISKPGRKADATGFIRFQGCHYVSAYAVTRHYGGPEEGGWWHDWYHHIESTGKLRPRKLRHAIKRLEAKHQDVIEGDINSVLGGTDLAIMCETTPGEFTTRRRPRYE